MRALSIAHPGGSLIASGRKTLEVRRWRHDLAPGEDLLIVENSRYLHAEGDTDPDGLAVAVIRLGAIRPFLPDDVAAACANYWEEGWLVWEVTHCWRLARPFRALAARRIYEVAVPRKFVAKI